MHTITICPRCGKDFMYHQSNIHLIRVVAWDGESKEPCSFKTICQECDEKETQCCYEQAVSNTLKTS